MEKKRKETIKWNIVNSIIAGGLVFLGSLSDGNITLQGFLSALIAAATVAFIKFKDFWRRYGSKKLNTAYLSFI